MSLSPFSLPALPGSSRTALLLLLLPIKHLIERFDGSSSILFTFCDHSIIFIPMCIDHEEWRRSVCHELVDSVFGHGFLGFDFGGSLWSGDGWGRSESEKRYMSVEGLLRAM